MEHRRLRHLVFTGIVIVIILSACAPAAEQTATPVVAIASPLPTRPTATQSQAEAPISTNEPVATEEPTPEPTINPGYLALLDYFQVAASGTCENITKSDPDLVATVRCRLPSLNVEFDQYMDGSALNSYLRGLRSANSFADEQNWTDACTSKPGGTVLSYFKVDQSAWLVWSVNAQNFIGIASRTDGDMNALLDWFAVEGVKHPCP